MKLDGVIRTSRFCKIKILIFYPPITLQKNDFYLGLDMAISVAYSVEYKFLFGITILGFGFGIAKLYD
jgi:hypothetical protein